MKLNYTIQRSAKRHKLTISVERDRRIIVHAPAEISEEKIKQVVEAKRQWIYEKIAHPQKYQNLPIHPGRNWLAGNRHSIWDDNIGSRWSTQGRPRFSSSSVS
jgi:hypothetical protein